MEETVTQQPQQQSAALQLQLPRQVQVQLQRPTKSCLKDTSNEAIPIRNTGWKNLPKLPVTPNNKNKWSALQLMSSKKTKNQSSTLQKARRNPQTTVQFNTIEIRSYDICIGDNPSVSNGTPISLDWNYAMELHDTVERYEQSRSLTKRRNMRQMMMNHNHRRNVLLHYWDATEHELQECERAMNTIRQQRNMTRTLLPLSPLEDGFTSLCRKLQRRRLQQHVSSSSPSQPEEVTIEI
jgi:hypothetical protein